MPASRVYRDLACPDGREIGGDVEEAREQVGEEAHRRENPSLFVSLDTRLQARRRGFVDYLSLFSILFFAQMNGWNITMLNKLAGRI